MPFDQQLTRRRLRVAFLVAVVSLGAPAVAGLVEGQFLDGDGRAETRPGDVRLDSVENVTFVSEQGRATPIDRHAGRLVVVHTPTGRVLGTHDEYRRYMDVDVLDDGTVLVVAGDVTDGEVTRWAVVLDWREGREVSRFRVPPDTHDVDHLGGDRYAVADKARHRAYVYDASNRSVVWEFDFTERFDAPPDVYRTDWTHLNDIDPAFDGSGFLLSPRDFDSVLVVNRTTGSVDLRLGEEGRHDVVHAQHNPDLVETRPPTVLVGDSENNRVVEYQFRDGDWRVIWGYRGELDWPRDADRLASGNTLITDSRGDRVVEVAPDGTVLWELETGRRPYDAERLNGGSGGPTDPANRTAAVPAEPSPLTLDHAYNLAGWYLPLQVGYVDFLLLLLALCVGGGWAAAELYWRFGGRLSRPF